MRTLSRAAASGAWHPRMPFRRRRGNLRCVSPFSTPPHPELEGLFWDLDAASLQGKQVELGGRGGVGVGASTEEIRGKGLQREAEPDGSKVVAADYLKQEPYRPWTSVCDLPAPAGFWLMGTRQPWHLPNLCVALPGLANLQHGGSWVDEENQESLPVASCKEHKPWGTFPAATSDSLPQ